MHENRLAARPRLHVALAGIALLAGALVWATSARASTAVPATSTAASPARRSHQGMVAQPLVARVGRLRHETAPPTGAECLADTGVRCYGPAQIEAAYDEQPLFRQGITGSGETIAVVDAFGAPDVRADLAHFDRAYGLGTPPQLAILKYGKVPAFDKQTGRMSAWAVETALDVEYAHATAPGADILLVETGSSAMTGGRGFRTIVSAENYVIHHHLGDVITQSFAVAEESFKRPETIVPLRSAYENADRSGVTVLAASGNEGAAGALVVGGTVASFFGHAVVDWPASDPLVTGVGGTQLSLITMFDSTVFDPLDAGGSGARAAAGTSATPGTQIVSTRVWNTEAELGRPAASGGGYSDVFIRPSYQASVASVVGDRRGVPDVSMSASCADAVNIYITGLATGTGWARTCGTSEASPLFSGIVALADQEAHHSLGLINPALYKMEADHDPGIVAVTRGNNSARFMTPRTGAPVDITGYAAHAWYNLATGVGTVNAALFVPELVAAARGVTTGPTTYSISPTFLPTP